MAPSTACSRPRQRGSLGVGPTCHRKPNEKRESIRVDEDLQTISATISACEKSARWSPAARPALLLALFFVFRCPGPPLSGFLALRATGDGCCRAQCGSECSQQQSAIVSPCQQVRLKVRKTSPAWVTGYGLDRESPDWNHFQIRFQPAWGSARGACGQGSAWTRALCIFAAAALGAVACLLQEF